MSEPHSSEAIYHAVPQAPVASNPVPSNSILDEENLDDSTIFESSDPLPDQPTTVSTSTWWILFMLGSAVLLPWNVMITAMPFFLERLEGSPLKMPFSSYLSVSFTASNLVFLAHATATSKKSSPSRRIRVTTLILSALTVLLTISTFFRATSGIFFAFVLLEGMAQAGLGSYLQCSVIAVASVFGPIAVQATMSGQAAVAVVVSGIQVVSAVGSIWSHDDPSKQMVEGSDPAASSASAFFSISTVFLLATTAAHAWLSNTPNYQEVTSSLERQKNQHNEGETTQLVSRDPDEDGHRTRLFRIANANILYEIAVAGVFTVTLAVFPAITTSIQPVSGAHPLLFSAVHFFLFNAGDFTGRQLCTFPRFLIWSDKRLLTMSLSRLLFIPLFLMCNIQGPDGSSHAIINSDLLFMLILFIFGLTNGYIASLCMIAAPSVEHNPKLRGRRDDVDLAATVASFCLVGGLALGSCASFAVRSVFCRCNPFST